MPGKTCIKNCSFTQGVARDNKLAFKNLHFNFYNDKIT